VPASIEVDGADQLIRGLGKLGTDLPHAIDRAAEKGADAVVAYAVSRVPRLTGKAARSIRVRPEGSAVRIVGGGRAAPYYPWLDFGGNVGRKHAVHRSTVSGGRYILAGYRARKRDFADKLSSTVADAAQRAGLAVT
jgi:hypothetical protein